MKTLGRPCLLLTVVLTVALTVGPVPTGAAAPGPERPRAAATATVTDPAGDGPAGADLTEVTYRHGPRWIGMRAATADLTRRAEVYLLLDDGGSSNASMELSVWRSGDRVVVGVPLYTYNEDATLFVRCPRRGRLYAAGGTVGVSISRPCLVDWLRRMDADLDLDQLRMRAVLTPSSRSVRTDYAPRVRLPLG